LHSAITYDNILSGKATIASSYTQFHSYITSRSK